MLKKPAEAVLFDMDGLLIDTDAVYLDALQAAARTMGVEIPLAFCHSMIGIPGRECSAMIQEFYGSAFRLDEFNDHLSRYVDKTLETHVPVKPGAVELLDWLDARGLPCALATSSSVATVQRHLGRAGLLDCFQAIAARDHVERGKPYPDLYLEAARRLGVSPERCIALEDSNNGILAVHAAGAMAIMVPDIRQPSPEVRAKCLKVLPDLHSVLELLRDNL